MLLVLNTASMYVGLLIFFLILQILNTHLLNPGPAPGYVGRQVRQGRWPWSRAALRWDLAASAQWQGRRAAWPQWPSMRSGSQLSWGPKGRRAPPGPAAGAEAPPRRRSGRRPRRWTTASPRTKGMTGWLPPWLTSSSSWFCSSSSR